MPVDHLVGTRPEKVETLHVDGVPDTRSTLGSLVPCCPAADGIAHTLLYTDGSRAYCACIHEIRQ